MPHPVYHAILEAESCIVRLRVNGFPVHELVAAQWREVTPPLNVALVGPGNHVRLEVDAVELADGRKSVFGDMSLKGSIERFDKGRVVEPNEGVLAMTIAIPNELVVANRSGEDVRLPFVIEGQFDSEGPGFGDRLLVAERFDDEIALIAYAMHLRQLALAGDAEGIAQEFSPRIRDTARAYDLDEVALRAEFIETVTKSILAKELVDFERHDVVLVPCCDGRITQLRRTDSRRLIETRKLNAGDTVTSLSVFAAPVEGVLRVVR